MATTHPRPLSPHLTIWRWGPNMVVSILHRATGVALSIAGLAVLTWWLVAIAEGQDAYDRLQRKSRQHPIGMIVLIGLTWSFFQHLLSGHPPPRDGHRRELRASAQQDFRDPDDRRLGRR